MAKESENEKKGSLLGDDAQPKSFSDKMYEEIESVIGGNTLVDANQLKYDNKNAGKKPVHVKANESKLVDKLFDASK